jgi:hypothetical protein
VAALAAGALLAVGPRTVAACLRVIGLAEHPGFAAFHRVLDRNAWSGLALARILLRMVVAAFVPAGPIVIGVDHTLERRRGRHIGPAGHFYDAGRSSSAWQATSRGLRWLSAMVLVEVPFAGHVWALPVLTALTPSKAWSERHGRRHRPVTDWARRLLLTLRRWLPDRTIVAVMDGEFAALELLYVPRSHMVVITRLRRDARLFDPPGEWDRRGRPALKGGRQPTLAARTTDPATRWRRVVQASRAGWRSAGWIEYTSGTALWHHSGKPSAATCRTSSKPWLGWSGAGSGSARPPRRSIPPPQVAGWYSTCSPPSGSSSATSSASARGAEGGRGTRPTGRPQARRHRGELRRARDLVARGLTVREAATRLRIGKTALYQALRAGH